MHNNEAVEFGYIWNDMTHIDFHICTRPWCYRMVEDSIFEGWKLQDIHSNMFHPLCMYDSWRSYVFFLQQKEEDEKVFTLP